MAPHSYLDTPKADEASHIFFSDAIRRMRLFAGLFRTHPPLPDRIRKLEPMWDGEFPEVTLPDISDGMSTPPDAPDFETSAFAGAPTEEAMSQAIQHIGSPRPEQIAFARSLHGGLPDLWIHAVHQAPMAQAMVFGLLLGRNELLRGTELMRVAELTDPQTADLTLRFHSEAGDRSSAEKIALFDMAIPTLRNLSLAEYERFAEVVDVLMQSDRRIDLFEYTLSRMIQRHLARHFRAMGPTPLRFRSQRPLTLDARVLLSTLARAGSQSEEEAVRAFRHGARTLQIRGARPCDSAAGRMHPRCGRPRARTLRWGSAAAQAWPAPGMRCHRDGRRRGHRPRGRAIRAIGDALDCPVPPFVQSR